MERRLRPASLYPHARGSVLVPLALFGLPERLEADGATWALKNEFHVTAAHTSWLAHRAGVSLDRAWSSSRPRWRDGASGRSASTPSCAWCATATSAR
jgi:hypothetical protein